MCVCVCVGGGLLFCQLGFHDYNLKIIMLAMVIKTA